MGYLKNTVAEEKSAQKKENQEKEIRRSNLRKKYAKIAQIRKLSLWIFYSINCNKSLLIHSQNPNFRKYNLYSRSDW